ncbi:hypothetical protein N7474_003170 [Penicillium riverlandense]|uniref:uncharacterized protein n=1 Tax=Penicillium riverlandense TaxID=1903569 RepID=UPI00254671BD|nr:uncharacterized protein N7474_003170 [Penicillium riverlandense]KAJ5826032.1 hypothetical protein N7474_003170 [Penicillium riverlandense]
MVSFSCENCGDVLTKKKLDPHRGQCRGASFTCIDCMVHFHGTEYRSHTSCMSEAQKYQGALYKEKPAKNNKKGQQNNKSNPNARQLQARVEDASESDNVRTNGPPPPAPTPPPTGAVKAPIANSGPPVNVFDYLVTDETPNASRVTLPGSKEQMTMVERAPSLFQPSKALAQVEANKTDDEGNNYDVAYEENGFSYGAGPIPPSMYPGQISNVSTEFVTPAPKKKKLKDRRRESLQTPGTVSEKKRKRGHGEELSSPHLELDTPMLDAPSSVLNNAGTPIELNHSGLTGGLNRMMRSPSLDAQEAHENGRREYQDVSSPIKRTRRNGKESKEPKGTKDTNGDGLGISIKNRAERFVSSMFGGPAVSGSSNGGTEVTSKALVRTRRGSSSSGDDRALEVRKPKKSSHRDAAENRKSKRKSSNPIDDGDRPSRRQKQIDERRGSDRSHSHSPRRNHDRQVTVYKHSKDAVGDVALQREMAHHFLSLVSRDSERGCSVHKALKRFHRDLSDEHDADRGRDQGRSRADRERRIEDEKDLWRALRLRRNDRGEIVVSV